MPVSAEGVAGENQAALAAIRNEMVAYLDAAFEDARRRIRRGFEDDLSPFSDPAPDPAANYPALLHRVTMQGYLGETLAVLAVERWGAHGHMDWIVPAFLFRLHDQEFQHLEAINERLPAGEPPKPNDVEILASFDVKQLLGIKLNPCLNGSPELVYESLHCGVGAAEGHLRVLSKICFRRFSPRLSCLCASNVSASAEPVCAQTNVAANSSLRKLRKGAANQFLHQPKFVFIGLQRLGVGDARGGSASMLVVTSSLPSTSRSARKLRQGVGATPPSTIRQFRQRPASEVKTTAALASAKSHD